MRVLRLEVDGPEGRAGIFMGHDAPIDLAIQLAKRKRGVAHWFALEDVEGEISPYRHPAPRSDVPAWCKMACENYTEAMAYYCGFASRDQLLAWFDSEALRTAMDEVGIFLVEFEVPDDLVMHGEHQVMFHRASAIEIGRSPVPTLAGMQVEPAALAA